MRQWTDFQIASHIPFLLVFFLCFYVKFYEMAILVGLVIIFSVSYHLRSEERTIYSYIDNFTAFTLSMYGNVQLFYSPSSLIFSINLTLGITSSLIFIIGYSKDFEEYYHVLHPIGMHILPAIWSGIVVVFQKPFIC